MASLNLATAIASDGQIITPDSFEQTLNYDENGNISNITVVSFKGVAYKQSFTWTNGKLTKISRWVKQ